MCVTIHGSVLLLLLGICLLQIVCQNRPATALQNGSHLILFHRVKWQHDMLFYSVTFGCSEPADCIRCEESPCYYEPLVTVCLWGCCQSWWVMQTCWSLIQYKENCFGGRHLSFVFFLVFQSVQSIIGTFSESLDKFTQRLFNNIQCSFNMDSYHSKCLYYCNQIQNTKEKHTSVTHYSIAAII